MLASSLLPNPNPLPGKVMAIVSHLPVYTRVKIDTHIHLLFLVLNLCYNITIIKLYYTIAAIITQGLKFIRVAFLLLSLSSSNSFSGFFCFWSVGIALLFSFSFYILI